MRRSWQEQAGRWRDILHLFIGGNTTDIVGTAVYDGFTTSIEEYMAAVDALQPGDLDIFEKVEQPAYVKGNAYLNGAKAFARESDKLEKPGFDPAFSLEETGGEVYLNLMLPDGFEAFAYPPQDTISLGRVRIVDLEFETPDGGPLTLDSDYSDTAVGNAAVTGPLSGLKAGKNRVSVWG